MPDPRNQTQNWKTKMLGRKNNLLGGEKRERKEVPKEKVETRRKTTTATEEYW